MNKVEYRGAAGPKNILFYIKRTYLGKHKAMKPGEKVVVGYSGGGASAALLHLLKVNYVTDIPVLWFAKVVRRHHFRF